MTMVVCILCFAIVFKLQKALRATEDVQGLNFPNVSAMADKKARARGQDKTREKGTAGAVTASCDRLDLRPYHVCQFGRSDGRLFGQATLTAQRSVLTLGRSFIPSDTDFNLQRVRSRPRAPFASSYCYLGSTSPNSGAFLPQVTRG